MQLHCKCKPFSKILGWSVSNLQLQTLAYYDTLLIMSVKSFIVQAQDVTFKKFFFHFFLFFLALNHSY